MSTQDLSSITTPYIDAVLKEIELASEKTGHKTIPTIFFGGGTPSLLPANEIARVIKALRTKFDFATDIEITLEANPDTVTREFLEGVVATGVNRISMGMQSASPHVLKTLDRTHDPANVISAAQLAKEAGISHLSVDLIYGVPGESISDWQDSIEQAFALPIDHISAYALIVETGTKLAAQLKRGELQMPLDDETAEKYLIFDKAAEAAGFTWYELSNWAKPGGECRHNIAYWNGSSWWGIGPGAHSYWSGRRWWNIKHPVAYQQSLGQNKSPEASSEVLTPENLRDEFIMLQIRMRAGILLSALGASELRAASRFRDSGHISSLDWESGRMVLTSSGRLIADRIVREMLL